MLTLIQYKSIYFFANTKKISFYLSLNNVKSYSTTNTGLSDANKHIYWLSIVGALKLSKA